MAQGTYSQPAPLAAMRVLVVAFAGALTMIGVVVLILASDQEATGSPPVGLTCAGVAVLGVGMIAAAGSFQRTLPCGDAQTIVDASRTRLFLRLAMSEAPAIVGFAALFFAGSPLPYAIAYVLALVGFWRAAPTQRNLAAEDERMMAAGCPVTISQAFAQLTPPTAPTSPA